MLYQLAITKEAEEDIYRTADYLLYQLKNQQATIHFLEVSNKEMFGLSTFPFGYRGTGFEYRGRKLHLKPFESYNIFFTINVENKEVHILRVLKDRMNWKDILSEESEYHY